MLVPTLVTSMLTSSITGAGLVIAFYALIANMSEKMFRSRLALIKEKKEEIEAIRSRRELFRESELQKTTQKLNDLSKKVSSINKFPRYIEIGVGLDFILFILSALMCTQWLNLYSEPYNPTTNDWLLVIWFMVAVALFALVGILGIADVRSTLKYQFSKLAEEKAEIKQEIYNTPKEIILEQQIEMFLQSLAIGYQSQVSFKSEQRILRPDIVIPSAKNPKYLIEVMANPNSDSVYKVARAYESLAKELGSKTILVGDFTGKEAVKKTATAYWTAVVDSNDLNQLKDVLLTQG